jgi:hypothetical protein
LPSFRGKPIYRLPGKKTYYTQINRQEETLDYTRQLLRTLLDSINRCSNVSDHKQDLNLFFESKDLLDTAAKYLSEEKEELL